MKQSAMASCQFWMISLLLLAGVFTLGIKEAQAEKKTGLSTARREDVPFIRCRVCEILSKQLVRQVKEKRDKAAPKKVYLPPTISLQALLITQWNLLLETMCLF